MGFILILQSYHLSIFSHFISLFFSALGTFMLFLSPFNFNTYADSALLVRIAIFCFAVVPGYLFDVLCTRKLNDNFILPLASLYVLTVSGHFYSMQIHDNFL